MPLADAPRVRVIEWLHRQCLKKSEAEAVVAQPEDAAPEQGTACISILWEADQG